MKLTLKKLVSFVKKNDAGLFFNNVLGLFQTNGKIQIEQKRHLSEYLKGLSSTLPYNIIF